MFDRFTDRARKVMSFARQEAERFNHDYIGTEHILLGLVKEGSGVAAKVLEFAIDEARALDHNYVGTEHLLLGLLREQEGLAAQVLMNLGLKLEDVRNEVMEFLGAETQQGKDAEPQGSGAEPSGGGGGGQPQQGQAQ